MSSVFNMVGGGAAGGAELPAIYATYPAGSVCTCTNGIKTFTAKDTTGFWLFAGLEVGTWTVTAADGTRTSKKNVEITSENQVVNVELTYRKYLVQNGVINSEIGVGFRNASGAQEGNVYRVSQGPNNALFYAAHGPVDLTAYKTLCVDLVDGYCWGKFIPRLAIATTASAAVTEFVAQKNIWDSTKGASMVSMGSGSFSLPVESFAGNYYCLLSADTVRDGYMKYSNMWLE